MMKFQLYDSAFEKCDRPEDMKRIWRYLQANGVLFATVEDIESAYYEFCRGDWIGITSDNDEILADFAEWLDEK